MRTSPERVWLDCELERVVKRPVRPSDHGRFAPPTVSLPPYSLGGATSVSGSSANVSLGFNGPPLTDADVRRLERSET